MGLARNAGSAGAISVLIVSRFGFDLSLQHVEGVTQDAFQLHKFPAGIDACLNRCRYPADR